MIVSEGGEWRKKDLPEHPFPTNTGPSINIPPSRRDPLLTITIEVENEKKEDVLGIVLILRLTDEWMN